MATPCGDDDHYPHSLPDTAAYGNGSLGGVDDNHKMHCIYYFAGRAGDVTVKYDAFDVSEADEVAILVNSTLFAYCATTPAETWTADCTVTIPASYLLEADTNEIEFVNMHNTYESKNEAWGIKNASIVSPAASRAELRWFSSSRGRYKGFGLRS